MEMSPQKKTTLSRKKVKEWVKERMDRGRWIYVADIPHLKQGEFWEFVDIIKEIIDEKDYGEESIWVELDSWHEQVKIFDYSGLYKQTEKWKQLSSNQETPGPSKTETR